MKILKLIHPLHGVCAQEVIRHVFNEAKIKGIWAKKYGQIINNCSYEIEDDKPKFEISNLKTGEVYKDKQQAKMETGLSICYINKQLGRTARANSEYYLVWTKVKLKIQ